MMHDVTRALIDLTASVSHDPDEADWYDVDEILESLTSPVVHLQEVLRYLHREFL